MQHNTLYIQILVTLILHVKSSSRCKGHVSTKRPWYNICCV